jgi:hypothetical protein
MRLEFHRFLLRGCSTTAFVGAGSLYESGFFVRLRRVIQAAEAARFETFISFIRSRTEPTSSRLFTAAMI